MGTSASVKVHKAFALLYSERIFAYLCRFTCISFSKLN